MSNDITVRDYFMAHAPAEPQPWFKPTLADERPKNDQHWQWCEGCKAGSDCDGNADCDELVQCRKDQSAWDGWMDTQRYIQWPRAWADEMLAERDRT